MVSFNTIAAIGLMALKAAMLLVTMMEMGCQWACNDGLVISWNRYWVLGGGLRTTVTGWFLIWGSVLEI